ncbi:hypothetical protein MD484_g1934, partial [Candolleomyces efflorescens]
MIRLPSLRSLLTWAYTQVSSRMPIPDAISLLCQNLAVFSLSVSSYFLVGKEEDQFAMFTADEDECSASEPVDNEAMPEQLSPSSCSSSSSSSSASTDAISMSSSATQDSDTGVSSPSVAHTPLSDLKDVECSPSAEDSCMVTSDALPSPAIPNTSPCSQATPGDTTEPAPPNPLPTRTNITTPNIPRQALSRAVKKPRRTNTKVYPKPVFCPFFSTAQTENYDTTKDLWRKRIDLARRHDRRNITANEDAELKRKASFIQRMPFIESVQWDLPSEFDHCLFSMSLHAAEEQRELLAEMRRRYGRGAVDGDDSPVSDNSDDEQVFEEEEESDIISQEDAVYGGDDDRLTAYYGRAAPKRYAVGLTVAGTQYSVPERVDAWRSGESAQTSNDEVSLPMAQPVSRNAERPGIGRDPQSDYDGDHIIRAGPMDSVNGAMYF